MTDFSQSLKITWTGAGSASLSGTVTRTADGDGPHASVALTASVVDHEVEIAFPYAPLNVVYMKSTTGCTVETNAADHTGGNIITLTAGVPLHFLSGAGMTNPFTHDVTKMYVTETDAAAGTLEIRLLRDVTP
jgi:hypothetical protein